MRFKHNRLGFHADVIITKDLMGLGFLLGLKITFLTINF